MNISRTMYDAINGIEQFTFVSRGMIEVKGKGQIEMFFVEMSPESI